MIWLLLLLALPAHAQPRSGYADATPDIRAMQDDDTANPAFLWVEQGRALWQTAGCAACHTTPETLHGAAAHYPKYNPALARPITLAERINLCRTDQLHTTPLPPESEDLLALTALVGLQSRFLPVEIDTSGPAAPHYEAGKALFTLRQGQLNLACATCHDTLAGHHLGGAPIPQGHPNAYPIYRLEWQSIGSLERRLRQCLAGVRAQPLTGTPLADLEFYLAARATGLTVETPGVRP